MDRLRLSHSESSLSWLYGSRPNDAMVTNPSYPVYAPLPSGQHLRLLTIDPGAKTSPLQGRLESCPLSSVASTYIAISYVWGAPELSKSIAINGSQLPITESAFDVLTALRRVDLPLSVWIDAICINQLDLDEKPLQVQFMDRIYASAKQTVVWLGLPGDQSDHVMRFADSLDAAALSQEYDRCSAEAATELGWTRKSHILDLLATQGNVIPDAKKDLVNACARFFLRKWYSRVWVIQEAAMCADTVVRCGDVESDWASIFALAWLFLPKHTMAFPDWVTVDYSKLEPHLTSITRIQSYRIREQQIRLGESTTVFSFLSLLHLSQRLQATDPRDKIFAMRNLASDLKEPLYQDWAPKPDYRISWQSLYADMAMALLDNDPKQFLNLSGVLRQGEDAVLPSWVPDFRQTPWTQYIVHPRWSAGGTQRFVAKPNRVPKKEQHRLRRVLPAHYVSKLPLTYSLTITILMQDAVAYLGGCIPSSSPGADHPRKHQGDAPAVLSIHNATLNQLASLESALYLTSESNLQAYTRTLIADTTDADALADDSLITHGHEQWHRYLEKTAHQQQLAQPNSSDPPAYGEAVNNMDAFTLKQFCITDQGYFCLVPSQTQPADVVAIVAGYAMPVVLRPLLTGHGQGQGRTQYYVLLGDCYVHGMMAFQAATLIEEFKVKVGKDDGGKAVSVVGRPEGDVRRNGLSLPVGEYRRVLGTLGARKVGLL